MGFAKNQWNIEWKHGESNSRSWKKEDDDGKKEKDYASQPTDEPKGGLCFPLKSSSGGQVLWCGGITRSGNGSCNSLIMSGNMCDMCSDFQQLLESCK